jgi:broad specificity phosphatase PhoE
MAAEVYLVRHGETEWNAQGRYQGKLDSRLTIVVGSKHATLLASFRHS